MELLATLAITALILAAVMPVTASLARSHALGQKTSEAAASADALHRLLASDLANAEQYRPASNGIDLSAHAALDPRTFERQHLAAVVRYEVRRAGATGWLVRIQDSPLGGGLVEAVCPGVRAIRLRSLRPDPTPTTDGWQLMPDGVVVSIAFETAAPVEFSLWTR